MARRRVTLHFSPALVTEPVIYRLGQQFPLITNIRRADVTQEEGWVMLELDGSADDIARGLRYCESLGVRVDPVEGDLAV